MHIEGSALKRLYSLIKNSIPASVHQDPSYKDLRVLFSCFLSVKELCELSVMLGCKCTPQYSFGLDETLAFKQQVEECLFASPKLLLMFKPFDFAVDAEALKFALTRLKDSWNESLLHIHDSTEKKSKKLKTQKSTQKPEKSSEMFKDSQKSIQNSKGSRKSTQKSKGSQKSMQKSKGAQKSKNSQKSQRSKKSQKSKGSQKKVTSNWSEVPKIKRASFGIDAPLESDFVDIPDDVFGAFGVISQECVFDCAQKATLLIGEFPNHKSFGENIDSLPDLDTFSDIMIPYIGNYEKHMCYRSYCFTRFQNEGKELNAETVSLPSFGPPNDAIFEEIMVNVLHDKFGDEFVSHVEGFGGFISGSFSEKFKKLSSAKESARRIIERARNAWDATASFKNKTSDEKKQAMAEAAQSVVHNESVKSGLYRPLFTKEHVGMHVEVTEIGSVMISGEAVEGVTLHTKKSGASNHFPLQAVNPFSGVVVSVDPVKDGVVTFKAGEGEVTMLNPPVQNITQAGKDAMQRVWNTGKKRIASASQEAMLNLWDKSKSATGAAISKVQSITQTAINKTTEISDHFAKNASDSWGGVTNLKREFYLNDIREQKREAWNAIYAKLANELRTGTTNTGVRALKEFLVDGKGDLSGLKRPSVIKREIYNIFKDTTVWGVFGNSQIFTYMALWVEGWLMQMVFQSDEHVAETKAKYEGKNRFLSSAYWYRLSRSGIEFFLRAIIDFLKHPQFWSSVISLLELAKRQFCSALSIAVYGNMHKSEWISSFMDQTTPSADSSADKPPIVDEIHRGKTTTQQYMAAASVGVLSEFVKVTGDEISNNLPEVMTSTVMSLAKAIPGAETAQYLGSFIPGAAKLGQTTLKGTATLISQHIKTQLEHWVSQQLWMHNLNTLMSLLDFRNCLSLLYINQNTNIQYKDLFHALTLNYEYGTLSKNGEIMGTKVENQIGTSDRWNSMKNKDGFVWGIVIHEQEPVHKKGLFFHTDSSIHYQESFMSDVVTLPPKSNIILIRANQGVEQIPATISVYKYTLNNERISGYKIECEEGMYCASNADSASQDSPGNAAEGVLGGLFRLNMDNDSTTYKFNDWKDVSELDNVPSDSTMSNHTIPGIDKGVITLTPFCIMKRESVIAFVTSVIITSTRIHEVTQETQNNKYCLVDEVELHKCEWIPRRGAHGIHHGVLEGKMGSITVRFKMDLIEKDTGIQIIESVWNPKRTLIQSINEKVMGRKPPMIESQLVTAGDDSEFRKINKASAEVFGEYRSWFSSSFAWKDCVMNFHKDTAAGACLRSHEQMGFKNSDVFVWYNPFKIQATVRPSWNALENSAEHLHTHRKGDTWQTLISKSNAAWADSAVVLYVFRQKMEKIEKNGNVLYFGKTCSMLLIRNNSGESVRCVFDRDIMQSGVCYTDKTESTEAISTDKLVDKFNVPWELRLWKGDMQSAVMTVHERQKTIRKNSHSMEVTNHPCERVFYPETHRFKDDAKELNFLNLDNTGVRYQQGELSFSIPNELYTKKTLCDIDEENVLYWSNEFLKTSDHIYLRDRLRKKNKNQEKEDDQYEHPTAYFDWMQEYTGQDIQTLCDTDMFRADDKFGLQSIHVGIMEADGHISMIQDMKFLDEITGWSSMMKPLIAGQHLGLKEQYDMPKSPLFNDNGPDKVHVERKKSLIASDLEKQLQSASPLLYVLDGTSLNFTRASVAWYSAFINSNINSEAEWKATISATDKLFVRSTYVQLHCALDEQQLQGKQKVLKELEGVGNVSKLYITENNQEYIVNIKLKDSTLHKFKLEELMTNDKMIEIHLINKEKEKASNKRAMGPLFRKFELREQEYDRYDYGRAFKTDNFVKVETEETPEELRKFHDYVHLQLPTNKFYERDRKKRTKPQSETHEFIVVLGNERNRNILSTSLMRSGTSFVKGICDRAKECLDKAKEKKRFTFDFNTYSEIVKSIDAQNYKSNVQYKFDEDKLKEYSGWLVEANVDVKFSFDIKEENYIDAREFECKGQIIIRGNEYWFFVPGFTGSWVYDVTRKNEWELKRRTKGKSDKLIIKNLKKVHPLQLTIDDFVTYQGNLHTIVDIDLDDMDRPYLIEEIKAQNFGAPEGSEGSEGSEASESSDTWGIRRSLSDLAEAAAEAAQSTVGAIAQAASTVATSAGSILPSSEQTTPETNVGANVGAKRRWVAPNDVRYVAPTLDTLDDERISHVHGQTSTERTIDSFGEEVETHNLDKKDEEFSFLQKAKEEVEEKRAKEEVGEKRRASDAASSGDQQDNLDITERYLQSVQEKMAAQKKSAILKKSSAEPSRSVQMQKSLQKTDNWVYWPYSFVRKRDADNTWVVNTHDVHRSSVTAHVPGYWIQKRKLPLTEDRMRLTDLADAINQLPILPSENDIWGNSIINSKLSDLNSGQKKQLQESIYCANKKARFEYAWVDWLWEAAFTRTYDKEKQSIELSVVRTQRIVSERHKNILESVVPSFAFNPKTYFQFPSEEFFADKDQQPPEYLGDDAFQKLKERLDEIDKARTAFIEGTGSSFDNIVMLTQNLFQYDVSEIELNFAGQNDEMQDAMKYTGSLRNPGGYFKDYTVRWAQQQDVTDDPSNIERTHQLFEEFMTSTPQTQNESAGNEEDTNKITKWKIDKQPRKEKRKQSMMGASAQGDPYGNYVLYFRQHLSGYRWPDNSIFLTKEAFETLNKEYKNDFYKIREAMLMQWVRGHNTFQTSGITVPMLRLHTKDEHDTLVNLLNRLHGKDITSIHPHYMKDQLSVSEWKEDMNEQGRLSKGAPNKRKFVCFLRSQGTNSSWWYSTSKPEILSYYLSGEFIFDDKHNVAGYEHEEVLEGKDLPKNTSRDFMGKNDLLFMFSGMFEISACAQVIDLKSFAAYQKRTQTPVYLTHAGFITSRVKAPSRRASWMNVYTKLAVYHLIIEGVKIPIIHDSQMSINQITEEYQTHLALKNSKGVAKHIMFGKAVGKEAARSIGEMGGKIAGGLVGGGAVATAAALAYVIGGPVTWFGVPALLTGASIGMGLGGSVFGNAAESMAELAPYIEAKEAGYIHHHFEASDLPDGSVQYDNKDEDADVPQGNDIKDEMDRRVKQGKAAKWSTVKQVMEWGKKVAEDWGIKDTEKVRINQQLYHKVGGSHGAHRNISTFLDDACSTQHEIETNQGKKISILSDSTLSYEDADGKIRNIQNYVQRETEARQKASVLNGSNVNVLFIDHKDAPWLRGKDEEYELPYRHIRYNNNEDKCPDFQTRDGIRRAYAQKLDEDPTKFLHDGRLFRTAFRSEFLMLLDEEVLSSLSYMHSRMQRVKVAEETLHSFMKGVLDPIQTRLVKHLISHDSPSKKAILTEVQGVLEEMTKVVDCRELHCAMHYQPKAEQKAEEKPLSNEEISLRKKAFNIRASRLQRMSNENKEGFGINPLGAQARDTARVVRNMPEIVDALHHGGRAVVQGAQDLSSSLSTVAGDGITQLQDGVAKLPEVPGKLLGVVLDQVIRPFSDQVMSLKDVWPFTGKWKLSESDIDKTKLLSASGSEAKKLESEMQEMQAELNRMHSTYMQKSSVKRERSKLNYCNQIQYVKTLLIRTLKVMHKKRLDINLDNVEKGEIKIKVSPKINLEDLEKQGIDEIACNFLVIHKNLQIFHIRIDEVAGKYENDSKADGTVHERYVNEKAFLNDLSIFDDGYHALVDFCVICLVCDSSDAVFQRVLEETSVYWIVHDHRSHAVFSKIQDEAEMKLFQEEKNNDLLSFLKRPARVYRIPDVNMERLANESADVIYKEVAEHMSFKAPLDGASDEKIKYNMSVSKMQQLLMYVIETQVQSKSGTVYSLSDLISAIVDDKKTSRACATNMQLLKQGRLISTIMDRIFWGGKPQSISHHVYENFFDGDVREKNMSVMKVFRDKLFEIVIDTTPEMIDGQTIPWRTYVFTNIIQNTVLSKSKNNIFELLYDTTKL